MQNNDKYEDALAKAKKWYDANTNEGYRKIFEDIFPELHKLSETEIIDNLQRLLSAEVSIGTFEKYGLTDDVVFSWLDWLKSFKQQSNQHDKNKQLPVDWNEKRKGLDDLETYILSLDPNRSLDAVKVDAKNIRFLVNKNKNSKTYTYIQKFNVGDTVCRQGWEDHTIEKIYNDGKFEPIYICKNEEGLESHIPFSEQYEWKLKDENKYDIGFKDGFLASEHNRKMTEEDIRHINNIIGCLEEFINPGFPIYKGGIFKEIKWLENLKNNK